MDFPFRLVSLVLLGFAQFGGACTSPNRAGVPPVAELGRGGKANERPPECPEFKAKRIEFLRAERARLGVAKRCAEGCFEHLPFTEEDEEREWVRARMEFHYHRPERNRISSERVLPSIRAWGEALDAEAKVAGVQFSYEGSTFEWPRYTGGFRVMRENRDVQAISKSEQRIQDEEQAYSCASDLAEVWLSQWWSEQDESYVRVAKALNDRWRMMHYLDLHLWDRALRAEEQILRISVPHLVWKDREVVDKLKLIESESGSPAKEGAQ